VTGLPHLQKFWESDEKEIAGMGCTFDIFPKTINSHMTAAQLIQIKLLLMALKLTVCL
jgi:hypothetical protein